MIHRAATRLCRTSPRGRAFVDAGFLAIDTAVGFMLLSFVTVLAYSRVADYVQVGAQMNDLQAPEHLQTWMIGIHTMRFTGGGTQYGENFLSGQDPQGLCRG